MSFPGASARPALSGVDALEARIHRFVGSDQSKWHRNIPSYSAVQYDNLYPGIDLIYYGSGSKIEYDFVVKPGADPSRIAVRFSGANKTEILPNGDLSLTTSEGEIRQHAPVVYQEENGVRTKIAGAYVRDRDDSIRFKVGSFDRSKPLIIDPVVTFASYLGGSGTEGASGTAIDAAGNIYVTGMTGSANFPVSGGRSSALLGESDVFVAKYTPAGTLVYATLLGGSDIELPENLAVDPGGNVVVFGITASTNFPTVEPIQPVHRGGIIGFDTFLFRLNSTGSEILASTYLGGNDDELAGNIALDREGSIYLSGTTGSLNFPVTPNVFQSRIRGAGYNAFVTKVNATGKSIVWSTYVGGTGNDFPHGVAVDSSSNVSVSGVTTSRDFPGANKGVQPTYKGGERDGFIFRLSNSGQTILYSTYFGGSGTETNWDIAVDSTGAAYVTGSTDSLDFPTTPGVLQSTLSGPLDAYVIKITPIGDAFAYATLFGGNRSDRGEQVVPGSNGSIWLAGDTSSANLPVQNAAQSNLRGPLDGFVAQLNATGSALMNSSYFGGSGIEVMAGLAIDSQQNAVIVGDTNSSDLAASAQSSQQNAFAGGEQDSFVAKINFVGTTPDLTITPSKLEFVGSVGASIASQSLSLSVPQGATINWAAEAVLTSGSSWLSLSPTRGSTSTSINVSPRTTGLSAGTYTATISITNQNSNTTRQIPVTLTISEAGAQIPANGVVNAASFQGGTVAAGEIVTIYGSRIGPSSMVKAVLGSDGKFPSAVSAVRVLFDGVPAPLLYVSETQLAAIVPYAVAGKSATQMQVEFQSSRSNSISLPVAQASPAFFTSNASGRGQGAFLNEDNSLNSASNPAAKGSIVVLYATGEGQTDPAGVDGQLASSVYPKPVLPVSVKIGGVDAEILYAGAAPELVAGVLQVNVRIPDNVPAGAEVPITLRVGSQQSPSGVTLAVQ